MHSSETITVSTKPFSTRYNTSPCILFEVVKSLGWYLQFSTFSDRFGNGNFNISVAAEYRFQRILDSIGTNPNFSFISPRYFTAYAEATFPPRFFVDGRIQDGQLNLTNARRFFQNSEMPTDFFRRNGSYGLAEVSPDIGTIFSAHPIAPGSNQGVGNYVIDPASANFSTVSTSNDGSRFFFIDPDRFHIVQFCLLYTNFVNTTVRSLYPNPKGALRDALNANLNNFFQPMREANCTQIFPYGQ